MDSYDILKPKNIKKKSIYTLISTLLLGGLIGAFALLFGSFGETELRILGSVISIGFFMLLILSTAIWVDTEYKYITFVGALLALNGFVLTMDYLWGIQT